MTLRSLLVLNALVASTCLLSACGSDGGSGAATGGKAGSGGGCEKCAGGSGGNTGGTGAASGGSSGSGGGAAGAGGSAGAASCLAEAQGIAVADIDLDAYPSYTVDGCRLVYVAAATNELRERDLQTGADDLVAPATEQPSRPSLNGSVLAWEAVENGKSVVRVRVSTTISTLSGSFDHAGEPRATSDAVIFTGWLGPLSTDDTDVFLYETGSQQLSLAAGGPKQQRFADVSPTHIAVSDFSEDATGVYMGDGTTLANVIVIDRASKSQTVVGSVGSNGLPSKQAFPMLGASGTLVYLEWLEIHPIPKLQAYSIESLPIASLAGTPTKIADVQSEQAVRPTARASLVEWVVRWGGVNSLWRSVADGSSPPVEVPLGSAAMVHAPSATSNMTVLAIRPTFTDAPKTFAISN